MRSNRGIPLDTQHAIDLKCAEEQREQQRRAERERQFEAALNDRRAKRLFDEVDAWERAETVRRYLEVLADRALGLDDPGERARLEEWIAWSRRWADYIDPTVTLGRVPGLEQHGDYWY